MTLLPISIVKQPREVRAMQWLKEEFVFKYTPNWPGQPKKIQRVEILYMDIRPARLRGHNDPDRNHRDPVRDQGDHKVCGHFCGYKDARIEADKDGSYTICMSQASFFPESRERKWILTFRVEIFHEGYTFTGHVETKPIDVQYRL